MVRRDTYEDKLLYYAERAVKGSFRRGLMAIASSFWQAEVGGESPAEGQGAGEWLGRSRHPRAPDGFRTPTAGCSSWIIGLSLSEKDACAAFTPRSPFDCCRRGEED